MIVMTISNWRRKLKLLLLLILVALIAGGIFTFVNLHSGPETAKNDRDVNGSLKVEATNSDTQEADAGWWGDFVETIKSYYLD